MDSITSNTNRLVIGNLHSGGLILGYRCPSKCRHCLYGCGPHRRDGAPDSQSELEKILDLLATRAPDATYHIGGGEPFLNLPLLRQAIEGMASRQLQLDYVETNAAWVKDFHHAREILSELAPLGLSCLLVSLSPFHAEYIPLRKTYAAIKAAHQVLPQWAFVWKSLFVQDLDSEPTEQLLDLDAFLDRRPADYALRLAQRYSLVAAGRAGRFLAARGQHIPWQKAADSALCQNRLTDTNHFHVDCQGNYIPGLCAGLQLPFIDLPGSVDPERFPLLSLLAKSGPRAAVELARKFGFIPSKTYSSSCDLCTELRFFLATHTPGTFPELGPTSFYSPQSLPGFKDNEQ